MKQESEITKENVEEYLPSGKGKMYALGVCKSHLASCHRGLAKRERDSKYLHKLVKEGIRGNHFLRYVDRIDNEIKDIQKAIKGYNEVGIG